MLRLQTRRAAAAEMASIGASQPCLPTGRTHARTRHPPAPSGRPRTTPASGQRLPTPAAASSTPPHRQQPPLPYMPFPPGQYGVGGPQARRPLPMQPVAQQRPGAVSNGHARTPSVPAFIRRILPAHPLASPPGPGPAPASRTPSNYVAPSESDLHHGLWCNLLSQLARLPGVDPARLLLPPNPDAAAADMTPEQLIQLLADNNNSLRDTQHAYASNVGVEALQARRKGKARAPPAASPAPATNAPPPPGSSVLCPPTASLCGRIIRKGEAYYRCRYVHSGSSYARSLTCCVPRQRLRARRDLRSVCALLRRIEPRRS